MRGTKTLYKNGVTYVVPDNWTEETLREAKIQSNAVLAAREEARVQHLNLDAREAELHQKEKCLAEHKWENEEAGVRRMNEHDCQMEINRLHLDTWMAITARIVIGAIAVTTLLCAAWLVGKIL